MDTAITRLKAALEDSNRCLGEAALRLEKIAPELSVDLLRQVQDNAHRAGGSAFVEAAHEQERISAESQA